MTTRQPLSCSRATAHNYTINNNTYIIITTIHCKTYQHDMQYVNFSTTNESADVTLVSVRRARIKCSYAYGTPTNRRTTCGLCIRTVTLTGKKTLNNFIITRIENSGFELLLLFFFFSPSRFTLLLLLFQSYRDRVAAGYTHTPPYSRGALYKLYGICTARSVKHDQSKATAFV